MTDIVAAEFEVRAVFHFDFSIGTGEKGNVPRSAISGQRKSSNFREELAPRAGLALEPATLRLTEWCRSCILLILCACSSGAILLLAGVWEQIEH